MTTKPNSETMPPAIWCSLAEDGEHLRPWGRPMEDYGLVCTKYIRADLIPDAKTLTVADVEGLMKTVPSEFANYPKVEYGVSQYNAALTAVIELMKEKNK